MSRKPRLLISIAAFLSAAVILTGCTSTSDDTTATDSTGDTNTVQTKFGDIEVPADAQRVVALGWGDAETALALGVQPIAASDWLDFGGEGVGPWADGLYDQAPEIIATMEPDFEQIASLEPDLILDVKSSGDQDRYNRLSQIAPTVGVPEGGDSYLTSLEQQVELIAAALGKSEEGQELVEQIDTAFADAATAHPEFAGKTVTVAAYTSEGWGAYVDESERVKFMHRLGFTSNEKIAALEADGFSVDISDEQIGLLDADLVVTFPIYLPASDVTDQELFQALPAVQDGRSIVFSDEDEDIRSAFSLNSVLSIPFAIDAIVPLAADALN